MMPRAGRTAVPLLFALLLAGCGASEPPGGPVSSPPGNPPPPCADENPCPPTAPVAMMDFLDCADTTFSFQVSRDAVEARLPPGYEVDGSAPVVTTGLVVAHCAQVVIDNTTVLADVGIASVNTNVMPPANVSGPSRNAFKIEFVSDNRTFVDLLNAQGIPAIYGTVQILVTTLQGEAHVAVEGLPWYDLQFTGEVEPNSPATEWTTRFHSWNGTTPVWMDEELTQSQSGTFGPTAATLGGGFLAEAVAGQAMGQSATLASVGQSDWIWRFPTDG